MMARGLIYTSIGLAVLASVLVVCGPMPAQQAQAPAGAAETDSPPLTTEALWQDIETFDMLYGLALTQDEATALLQAIGPVLKLRLVAQRLDADSGVLAALRSVRDTAAVGKRPTEADWEKVRLARREAAQKAGLEELVEMDDVWQSARNAAFEMLTLLTDRQVVLLGMPEAAQVARELVEQMGHVRNEPRTEWNEWASEFTDDLEARFGVERADMGRVFDDARALTPDEFFAQRDELAQRVFGLLANAVGEREDDETAREPGAAQSATEERAAHRLAEQIVHNERLVACLRQYAENVGAAAGTAGEGDTAPGD